MEKSSITIDEVARYWDTQPCNIRHSAQEFGSRAYFDEVEARKYYVEPHIPIFADFGAFKNKKVLEIGCGIGTDAINFARSGAVYTGLELSKQSLEITRDRFNVFNLRGRLIQGDAENVDKVLCNEKFDLIYSFGVLHHTPNIDRALMAIRNLMNEHSILKLMVYSKNSYKAALIEEGLDQPEAQYGCPIANTYSREEITSLLHSNGLIVKSVNQTHIFPYIVKDYKQYVYKREPWFESMPNEIFEALEKHFGWHLLVTATTLSKGVEL